MLNGCSPQIAVQLLLMTFTSTISIKTSILLKKPNFLIYAVCDNLF